MQMGVISYKQNNCCCLTPLFLQTESMLLSNSFNTTMLQYAMLTGYKGYQQAEGYA